MRGFFTEDQVAQALQQILSTFIVRFLRPFQQAWLADQRQLKAGVMSRQIGKSEVTSAEVALVSLEPRREPEQTTVVISASDAQAQLMLRKVRRWLDLVDGMARKVLGFSIYDRPPSSEQIILFNGIRVVSIPPNPRTAAGYTGHLFWDEGGRTPNDRELYAAVMPIVEASGFKFRIIGTPWGDSGEFWEILEGEDGKGRPGWSRHRVTIHDAIAQGLQRDLRQMRLRYPDPDIFAQEFECRFISDLTSAFPRDLVMAAMRLRWHDGSPLPPVPAGYADVERSLGVDIGEINDPTAKVWLAAFPKGYYQVERTEKLQGVPFDDQQASIVRDIEAGIRAINIDATGVGAHLAQSLHNRFPHIVTPVKFTEQVKSALVASVLSLLSSHRLKLGWDNDLISDLSAVKKSFTRHGNVVYSATRTKHGHADLAWALCLGVSRLIAVASENAPEWNLGLIYDGAPGVTADRVSGLRAAGIGVAGTAEDFGDRAIEPDRIPTPEDLGIEPLTEEDLAGMTAEEISAWLAATGGVGGF